MERPTVLYVIYCTVSAQRRTFCLKTSYRITCKWLRNHRTIIIRNLYGSLEGMLDPTSLMSCDKVMQDLAVGLGSNGGLFSVYLLTCHACLSYDSLPTVM